MPSRAPNPSSFSTLAPVQFMIREWPIMLATCFGAFLRGYQLLNQIPAGDEWHNIDAIWRLDLGSVLTAFDPRYSTPMVLYGKLILHTTGLSELALYLPTVLTGFVMIVLFPLIARSFFGRQASNIFAWLLSISPMLVLYSRFFRPYIFICLGGGVCLWLSWQWLEKRRLCYGLAYAACATATISLHVITAAFVLTPLPFFLLRLRREDSPDLSDGIRQMILVTGSIALSLFALVGIPIFNRFDILTNKLAGRGITLNTAGGSAFLFTGTNIRGLTLFLLLVSLWGLYQCYSKHPEATRIALTACLLQFVGIILSAPPGISSSLVFSRYMILILPLFLLSVAVGSSSLLKTRALRLPPEIRTFIVGFALILLLAAGPLPKALYRPNAWSNLTLHVEMLQNDSRNRIRRFAEGYRNNQKSVSAFYQHLASLESGKYCILESPWFFRLSLNRYPWLQSFHHQNCRIGVSTDLSGKPPWKGEYPYRSRQFKFRNLLFLGRRDLPEKVDFIVLHRDLFREFGAEQLRQPELMKKLKQISALFPELEIKLREIYGPPDFSDSDLIVFAISAKAHWMFDSWHLVPGAM